jgi:hypothetical protein
MRHMDSLRAWGSISRGLEPLDDPVGEGSPPITPNPMIIERDNPKRRGNARDMHAAAGGGSAPSKTRIKNQIFA